MCCGETILSGLLFYCIASKATLRPQSRLTRSDPAFAELLCETEQTGRCSDNFCQFSLRESKQIERFLANNVSKAPDRLRRAGLHRRNGSFAVKVQPVVAAQSEDKPLTLMLHHLFYAKPVAFACERPLCRLGPNYDGGWSVCLDNFHLASPECVIYSIGISVRPYFDVSASALGCEIHMYDHTVSRVASVLSRMHRRLHFHHVGLTGKLLPTPNLITLPEMAERNGHQWIDVLKIDCDGCEWQVFHLLTKSHPNFLNRVGQLLVEVHAGSEFDPDFSISRLSDFAEHVIKKHGFVVVERHLNVNNFGGAGHSFRRWLPRSLKSSANQNATTHACWELVFLRPTPASLHRRPILKHGRIRALHSNTGKPKPFTVRVIDDALF
mmetsp:Transcript_22776/g.37737  ORF Transcript_22776/g.37737 Transcript_22776/m.37737 type:complete len:382 (+) Transcript_22776:112-1257(+)